MHTVSLPPVIGWLLVGGGACVPAYRAGREKLKPWSDIMTINLGLTPLVSLLAGILILVMPRLLNFIVALYLIVIGLIGLFGAGNYHF